MVFKLVLFFKRCVVNECCNVCGVSVLLILVFKLYCLMIF